jgi:DNA-binding phage protein
LLLKMALTRSFKETIQARAQSDPAFRDALLTEAVEALLSDEIDTGKAVLRDYVNATIGFVQLARETGIEQKSLMRMLTQKGNPTAKNLLSIINQLQRSSGVSLRVYPRTKS